jgi:hypothetical protein
MIELLAQANQLFTSAILITGLALLLYILSYNRHSDVARAFAALLSCVIAVYVVDMIVFPIASFDLVARWLRLQWVGIAFAPPTYLHFSTALLRTTNARYPYSGLVIGLNYVLGGVVLLAALLTDLIVYTPATPVPPYHLAAGPAFWAFAVYYFTIVAWGALNINWARRRCLTSTSRRRMGYAAISFIAPGVGIFPYLLITSWPGFLPQVTFWLLLVAGNVAVALMLIVLAYSVAYFGVLAPDRVVKRRMILFLMRGPVVAWLVLGILTASNRFERAFGLSGEIIILYTAAAAILLMQLVITAITPIIDRLIYHQNLQEIGWLRTLDERLLTSTDMRQFLENVLTAMCDLLRTPSAFMAMVSDQGPRLEVVCGPLEPDGVHWTAEEWHTLTGSPENGRQIQERVLRRENDFFVWDGYWLLPLRTQAGDVVTGVIGLAARSPHIDLTEEEQNGLDVLVQRAEIALEDWHLQQHVFAALELLIPEIDNIQRQRGAVRYRGSPALQGFEGTLIERPEFLELVKDALRHYWGGPKLSDSPLLQLRIVERTLAEHDDNPIKALRAVLAQAIERLRPDGKRKMAAAEWILYNILELKFIQGKRVRDVAARLAMSESDLYRKQRVAIEEVAHHIAEMERQAREQALPAPFVPPIKSIDEPHYRAPGQGQMSSALNGVDNSMSDDEFAS